MAQDEGRFLHLLDDLAHDKSFARASRSQQCLVLVRFLDAVNQLCDGLRLVPSGLKVGYELESRHVALLNNRRSLVLRMGKGVSAGWD